MPARVISTKEEAHFVHQRNTGFGIATNALVMNMPEEKLSSSTELFSSSNFLMAEISVGSSEQSQMVIFHNIIPVSYLINGDNCTGDLCNVRERYKPSQSKTFQSNGTTVKIDKNWNGTLSKDLLKIGQLSANQTFLLLNTSFDLALECDGLLSLAYSTTDSEEKMSVENLLEQFDEKVVSIWLDDSPSANNAKITFGAKDITNCQDDWYFTDIQPLDVQTVKTRNYWALPASKLQINNTTYRDQSLVISTEGGGVWGPKTIIDSVMKDLMEKMNISAVPLTMGCHQTVWPTFKFTVNSRVFEIQPRDYIQEALRDKTYNSPSLQGFSCVSRCFEDVSHIAVIYPNSNSVKLLDSPVRDMYAPVVLRQQHRQHLVRRALLFPTSLCGL
ncbi:eukaryotic aspartyl protease domain-containing protein [Ditylenchus destructor]|uniref:Eukaryotic aspartyl protease domain-containing protein n=1 Tax=Ditylenchus destructor TaxID=166010 RepID=A0AAD4N756_9BILA|nr:eukaryotic aspartyl protease domain-containing protein [Ditylenchus destructor]